MLHILLLDSRYNSPAMSSSNSQLESSTSTGFFVHTLNARDNVMLGVMRDYFDLASDTMLREIQGMLTKTEPILLRKGIRYGDLKAALVPSTKKREIALFFDTQAIKNTWYALPIFTKLIPLISKKSSHSVLAGDYIGKNNQQQQLFEALSEKIELARSVTWRHSTQFFIVYINNLSDQMVSVFRDGLADFEPYVGLADLTFASRLKIFLSMMLPNCFLNYRETILMGHPDDEDNTKDVNERGYPFNKFGFTCRSIQASLFDNLLSYKIERPVFKGLETDVEFSINAVHPKPMPLSSLEIRIEDNKFGYLTKEKSGTLKRLGLLDHSVSDLKTKISQKISSNYIYNMSHDPKHKTTKFDILLEITPDGATSPTRILVAFEYMPNEKCLRLITLY
jgi:hypothetical protein